MITVVISVFNEMNNMYLPQILKQFKQDAFFEVMCIDGGSSDGTFDFLKSEGVLVHVLPDSTRAARLNYGIQHAKTAAILLQHPRALISDEGIKLLKSYHTGLKWAAFTHQFDKDHFFLKFISWYSNYIRVKKKRIVYLDHCMLVNKSHLKIGVIPDLAIFEDTALSLDLRKQCRPMLLSAPVVTSAIRFLDRGIYRHFCLNQWIKLLYALQINSAKINQIYEKKLNLNQKN